MKVGWTETIYSDRFETCRAPRVRWNDFKRDKYGMIYLWKLART